MNQNIENSLIEKFLRGHCSDEEQELLNFYFETSEGKKHLDDFLKNVWHAREGELNSIQLELHKKEFLKKAMEQQLISDLPLKETKSSTKTLKIKKLFYSVSAAIILALLGLAIYNYKINTKSEYTTAKELLVFENNKPVNISLFLPDSSTVILGPESKLSYYPNFEGEFREVNLEGEGYFDVHKDSTRRFIIHSGSYQTKVLGTSFLIKTDKKNNFNLYVTSGVVSVDHKAAQGVVQNLGKFIAGDNIQVIGESGEIKRKVFDQIEVNNWKNGIISFDSQPLSAVIDLLEKKYNKKINVNNQDLLNVSITIQISNGDKLNDILDVISISLGVNYKEKAGEIFIE